MRRISAACGLFLACVLPSPALALEDGAVRSRLAAQMARAGSGSGALVVDLTTGETLYGRRPDNRRIPASVQKLWTTSTALARFGADARLRTAVLGTGSLQDDGTWRGTLYIKGFGDPTFGSSSYARRNYGSADSVSALATALVAQTGIRRVTGGVLGDESYFDAVRGGVYTTGRLSALAFNRGLVRGGSAFLRRPAGFSSAMFAAALRDEGVRVSGRVAEGVAPVDAEELTEVESPDMATLARLTNRPSDNFLAEMLLKGLGARFGKAGTTAAGSAVVRARAAELGLFPSVADGSGLSRSNRSTPREVVTLLTRMRGEETWPAFERSLAVAGRSGTVAGRMRATAAQDRCRGKTGTLSNVSALAGYCTTSHRHVLAFAFLMNRVSVSGARRLQDRMAVAIARYTGGGEPPSSSPTRPPSSSTATPRRSAFSSLEPGESPATT